MLLTEKYKKQIYYQFPKDFLWGVAMSAKQAEGADDRALTVADLQNYDPNDKAKVKGDLSKAEILDRLNYPERYNFPKKIGIEFYHRYKEDLILLKEMGITCFRFSISWARVFPNGIDGEPSEQGLKYYDKIFNLLKEMGIVPIVTLYHDDMPIDLALKYNGFLNEKVVTAFIKYATLIMQRYKDKVTYWIPVNQINLTRVGLSSLGIVKDTVTQLEQKKYQAIHNKFVVCAKIKEIGSKINNNFKFGCMLADFLVTPMTCKPKDVVFSTEKNQMTMYFYADVQLRGEYPGYAISYFSHNHIAVEIKETDLVLIKENTLDFLAISYYNSNVVSHEKNTLAIGDSQLNPYLETNPWGWTINPLGLYDCFLKYWDRYQKPLMIAENGICQIERLDNDTIHDDYRIDYIREHIIALNKAITRGVKVFAYCAWSPIDMVSSGTSEMKKRYGFIYNDQDDYGVGSHKRYKKDSYIWYQNVIKSNGLKLE